MTVSAVQDAALRHVCGYRDDAALRGSFNALTRKVFGFDFEEWFGYGYWGDRYIPHSLAVGDTVVANVSVNVMDFLLHGSKRKYVQLGTVMTAPEYRGRGLSRVLLERVLNLWKGRCDMVYLFANPTVLDFYPKFGFHTAQEYRHEARAGISESASLKAMKADMDDADTRSRLFRKIESAVPVSELSMRNNPGLAMFYCTGFMKDNVYFLPHLDAYAVAALQGPALLLHDWFCDREIAAEEIVSALAAPGTRTVEYGFTPLRASANRVQPREEKDDTLFVLGGDAAVFEREKLIFPALSHA